MAQVQRSNYLPYIQQHLDTQDDLDGIILETVCGICQENKLDISMSAREFTTSTAPPTEHFGAHPHFLNYARHGIERTVALACGHVFGDRCISDLIAHGTDLTCPSCGFRMSYRGCGHAIRPALLPVDGDEPIRDRFPVTIAEGGIDPHNCTECRWKLVKSNLRYILADECVICRQRTLAHVPLDATTHRTHREQHINIGLRHALDDLVALIWPEFVTRETETSAMKAATDNERRQIHGSLLYAMVLSEIEDTLWYRTKAGKGTTLTKEQSRKHARGVASVEQSLLSWLMNSSRELRRMW
ncbi:uncharacterized protein F4807DRAFT_270886 [Annulohypoxylon truncatum]|uniref:uncharacterized protein n=1 Tax=Annulohypoxylon truncatum TaxID=327061 RepID=UPI0020074241|nr:uncharacterized protein F4807DRAFT_270886 [Annulohypoxylon truncatum]KAI1213585.1 hypothetical protein F4807DRAFT_270886 [Annulohypoxylon truncatum]